MLALACQLGLLPSRKVAAVISPHGPETADFSQEWKTFTVCPINDVARRHDQLRFVGSASEGNCKGLQGWLHRMAHPV
jgi:hypothetical protein